MNGSDDSWQALGADQRREALIAHGYLPDENTVTAVHIAARLVRPLLVEGPAGTGKTQLAKAIAAVSGRPMIRLQCYEGLDESRALYEWDYRKQLLRIQSSSAGPDDWGTLRINIFSEEFLLERPLLAALRSPRPTVLLIDEVDRLDVETEALLLEMLAESQVSIPELGTVHARSQPTVVLTSNNTRELSEALKRRCLFLYLDYPTPEREAAIVRQHIPELAEHLVDQVCALVAMLRGLDLRKAPSVSETIDWARTLIELGVDDLEPESVKKTLSSLLKHRSDFEVAIKELGTAS